MKIARRKFPYRSEESQTELRFSQWRWRDTIAKAHNGLVAFVRYNLHSLEYGYLIKTKGGPCIWYLLSEWELCVPAKTVSAWAYVTHVDESRRQAKKDAHETSDYYPIDRRRERRQRRKEAA